MNRREFIESTIGACAVTAAVPLGLLNDKPSDERPVFRSVFVAVADGEFRSWEPRAFEQMKKGDLFFFADDPEGRVMQATSDPVPVDPVGNFAIYAQECA